MVVDDHDEALARFGLVGRYEPDERGQYTDMPDPSKSPQFLDDCLHRSDLRPISECEWRPSRRMKINSTEFWGVAASEGPSGHRECVLRRRPRES